MHSNIVSEFLWLYVAGGKYYQWQDKLNLLCLEG